MSPKLLASGYTNWKPTLLGIRVTRSPPPPLPISTRPSKAFKFAPSRVTLPPRRIKLRLGETSNPTGLLSEIELVSISMLISCPGPAATISPGFAPNCSPIGTLTFSNGGASGLVALKKLPLSNLILPAVLPIKEPPMFKRALGPKTIPLGLIKNRLALPLARRMPSILEMFAPVTREKMWLMVAALSKKAVLPVLRENSWKL